MEEQLCQAAVLQVKDKTHLNFFLIPPLAGECSPLSCLVSRCCVKVWPSAAPQHCIAADGAGDWISSGNNIQYQHTCSPASPQYPLPPRAAPAEEKTILQILSFSMSRQLQRRWLGLQIGNQSGRWQLQSSLLHTAPSSAAVLGPTVPPPLNTIPSDKPPGSRPHSATEHQKFHKYVGGKTRPCGWPVARELGWLGTARPPGSSTLSQNWRHFLQTVLVQKKRTHIKHSPGRNSVFLFP